MSSKIHRTDPEWLTRRANVVQGRVDATHDEYQDEYNHDEDSERKESPANVYSPKDGSYPASIQDRIGLLQMAQKGHTVTRTHPPVNGVALILPEIIHSGDNQENVPFCDDAVQNVSDDPITWEDFRIVARVPSSHSWDATTWPPSASSFRQDGGSYPKTSFMCILPGRLFRPRRGRRRQQHGSPKCTVSIDTSTVRLLEEEDDDDNQEQPGKSDGGSPTEW